MGVTSQSSPVAVGAVSGGMDVDVVTVDGLNEHGNGVTIIAPVVTPVWHVYRSFSEMSVVLEVYRFGGHDKETSWIRCMCSEGGIVTGRIKWVVNLCG